ncbi:Probable 6-phosphogluconolactonase 1 [Linum perenne]
MEPSGDQRDRGELRVHESLDELSTDLADYIADLSEASVKERGDFAIALSGGSLNWSKWYIFWVDERVVSKSHADSNYKLAKDGLLSKEAADDYEFAIRQLVKTRTINVSDISDCPKFDLILLGMGPDGHVASLFPNHPALNEKEEWVTFITDSPKPPPERITFTLPVINSASNVAIVATGESKADALHLAISNAAGPDGSLLPARMVQPMKGKLVWFLDKPAASKLEGAKLEASSC